MEQDSKYRLPVKEMKKLNKNKFVVYCSIFSCLCAILVALVLVPCIGVLCGIIPVPIVAILTAAGQIAGTVYYIKKHKYAYGDDYQWYQIINSVIYGIQNVLRVLLFVVLFNICAVPVFILLVIGYMIYLFRKVLCR